MNLMASAPGWLAAILFLLLVLAAAEDAWRLRISNWTGGGIVVAAAVAVLEIGPTFGLWQNLLLLMAVLAAGTLLFARGWMGGGDVKLLAAAALWFDLSSGWKLVVAIAIAGGIEALLVIGMRRLPWPEGARRRALLLRRGEGIPYGIAIASGVALMGWWLRS